MLWAVVIVLGLLWALGAVGSYAVGGYVHLLLAVAIGLIIYRVYTRRRALRAP